MQTIGKLGGGFLLSTALVAGLGAMAGRAGAQTSANGQVVPPGTQNHSLSTTACSGVDANGMPVSPNDTSCGAFAPGFAQPTDNVPVTTPPTVMTIVRVEAVIEKPATTPFPMDYNVVGAATMVKAKMPRLRSCYTAGKMLAARSGAATSTTCLDHKGEVIAYQECKPKIGDTPMVCSTFLPADQGSAVASAK